MLNEYLIAMVKLIEALKAQVNNRSFITAALEIVCSASGRNASREYGESEAPL